MSVDKPKGIIDGFEDDVDQIAQEFPVKHPELKLIDFFRFWSDKKLDLLFVNRFDPRELLEAINEMNKKLVSLLQSQDNSRFIISLYMLLCIHVKQPQRHKRSIRITIDELIKVEKSLSEKPDDASFAWRCLKNSNALYLAEEKTEYGPQLLKKGGNKLYSSSDTTNKPMDLLMNDTKTMVEGQSVMIDDITSVYARYVQILETLGIKPSEAQSFKLERVSQTMAELKRFVAQKHD